MTTCRAAYVLDDAGWDDDTRLAATRQALALVRRAATSAETDIPWHQRERWPANVAGAAERLRDRYVPKDKWAGGYLQTGVVPLVDDQAREDFLTFAPYAYDATIWSDDGELASLADEGTSLVVSLTDEDRMDLERTVGSDRVVTLRDWRQRHQSAIGRLARRLAGRR